jgi:hypothetical protein
VSPLAEPVLGLPYVCSSGGLQGFCGTSWVRGQDTLDVWFDSGVSWYAALQPSLLSPGAEEVSPSDAIQSNMVLEGSDQHRGAPLVRNQQRAHCMARGAPHAVPCCRLVPIEPAHFRRFQQSRPL